MEKKQTKKVTIAAVTAGAITPKKKKKRYYPSKKSRVQAIAAKGEKKVKVDGNLASAKTAEKAKPEVVEMRSFKLVIGVGKEDIFFIILQNIIIL